MPPSPTCRRINAGNWRASHERRIVAGSEGYSTKAVACPGCHCVGAVRGRSSDEPATVLSRLPGGLCFLDWHTVGMLGSPHAASSCGWTMGVHDSALVGGRDTNLSADGLALYPIVVRPLCP